MHVGDLTVVARIERTVFGGEGWPRAAFAYALGAFALPGPSRGRFWVAHCLDGRVVGYTGVELSVLGGEADIVNLAVDPACRRQGVGRRLLTAATDYCRRRGVALVWLRVRASNRGARAFYRRGGFQTVGRFRDYYDLPREDAILMSAVPPVRVST
jgi:ribosomal-protein-alanine N-acetyltransferase